MSDLEWMMKKSPVFNTRPIQFTGQLPCLKRGHTNSARTTADRKAGKTFIKRKSRQKRIDATEQTKRGIPHRRKKSTFQRQKDIPIWVLRLCAVRIAGRRSHGSTRHDTRDFKLPSISTPIKVVNSMMMSCR